MSRGDDFLSRWSRLKSEARKAQADAAQGPAPAPAPERDDKTLPASGTAPAAPAAAHAPLPALESLRGLDSEYDAFFKPGVDDALRRGAMKKLFQDPHFNRMDGLDTYIDDYTVADPIPEAMLRQLNQARGLLFGEEKGEAKNDAGVAQPPEPAPEPARAEPAGDEAEPAPGAAPPPGQG